MTTIQAIILGLVEGMTEFLPISSTGHLILAGKLLGITDSEFNKSFIIAIQLGAILSVVFLYWKKIFSNWEIWKKITFAFLPTAVLGFLFYKILKSFLIVSDMVVLWALFLGGIFLILFEIWYKKNNSGVKGELGDISYKKSFIIGVIQSLSIIPGVSRAAATIVGGLMMGLSRKTVVEFSFLLAIPTILAATLYDLYKTASEFSFDNFYILALGFLISFVVSAITIKWLLHFIKNNTFILFGVYRVLIALLFWFLVI